MLLSGGLGKLRVWYYWRSPASDARAKGMPVRLPNGEMAVITREKTAGYALLETHPGGGSKARFFKGFGFHPDRWEGFAAALRQHCLQHEVLATETTAWGVQYVIVGALETPDGRNTQVRSVWQIDHGADYPRFITARPAH